MIWLYILLGFLGLLAVLLAVPVKIFLSFQSEQGFEGWVRYLFFTYHLPEQEIEKAVDVTSGEEKKPEEGKKGKFQDILSEKGFFGFLEFLSELASIINGAARRLFSHLVIQRLKIAVTAASNDAATTAVLYGTVCTVVYPAASALLSVCRCRQYQVQVTPDFEKQEASAEFLAFAQVRLLFLVSAGIYALLRYVKLIVLKHRQKANEPYQNKQNHSNS